MRNLNTAEICSVSGGLLPPPDENGRYETVTVTASRESISPFYSLRLQADGGGSPGEGLYLAREGGGNIGVYDPSPDDGIFGVDIIEVLGDGNIRFQIEIDGFYDLNGDGIMQTWEGPVLAGPPGVTTGGWNTFDDNMQAIQSFTPLPPPAVPGV